MPSVVLVEGRGDSDSRSTTGTAQIPARLVSKAAQRRQRSSVARGIGAGCAHSESGLGWSELRPDEFVDQFELGTGFGGIVYQSIHAPTGTVMARKVMSSRISSSKIQQSLIAELATLQKCRSKNIVTFYGAFLSEMQVSLAMELMDVGSLDWVCRTVGPIPESILSQIVYEVLTGLVYLHHEHNIMHRDMKPSNILLNSKGEVKLCDFGESIELVNSLAKSLVGTTGYMAPERIQGLVYSIQSDIWSLGITMVELATGRFPFHVPLEERSAIRPISAEEPLCNGESSHLALVELWEAISSEPSPGLDPHHFSPEFVDFIRLCLSKSDQERPSPYLLLDHPFAKRGAEHRTASGGIAAWSKDLLRARHYSRTP